MEGHGRTAGPEGSQTESIAERTGSGGETGLEQPIWQLGLGGGGGEAYPERPGLADCIYYLRTGFCGYGPRCRFSHPRDRSAVLNALQAAGADYPERVGQPICQYYMRTGMCKFGASCKFHHPRQGIGSVSQVSYNYYGYPLRPGEKECSYYVKTGKCKFGVTCKFHHPQLAGVQMPLPAPAPGVAALASHVPGPALYPSVQSSSQQFGVVAGNWQVARPPMATGSLLQGSYGGLLLPPGMVHLAGWSPYSAPISPVPPPSVQPAVGSGQFYGITQLSPSAPVYTGGYPPMPASVGPSSSGQAEQNFPERQGQPECQYYLKTGDCKFGSSCKYHHPRELATAKSNYILSPMNLPLRPGAAPCSYYAQHGVCKFGPTCKFDHPMGGALSLSYSPSASSLADMPVAPFPMGSSIGTLAPSFSSSDSQPELLPGPGKDSSSSTRMSSSTRAMSGSVGSMLSRNGSAPHVDARPSGQVSDPSSGSSSTEARSS